MSTKTQRHAAILRLVQRHHVPSQETLRSLLADEGIDVTQGTLSRDIRELGLLKTHDDDGNPAYSVPVDLADPTPTLQRLTPALFVSADGVRNLLVVKTLVGGAQPLAVALDHAGWDEVLGTIAGDDTILVILRADKHRRTVQKRLEDLAGA